MAKPNKKQDWGAIIDFLQSVNEQSEENGLGYSFTTQEAHTECLNLGYVVVDLNVSNELGYATKITASGIEAAGIEPTKAEVAESLNQETSPLESDVEATPNPSPFQLVLLTELPSGRKRSKIDMSNFPFDVMEIGHSFFVANPADIDPKDHKKDYANLANRATLKFSSKVEGKINYTKKFSSRSIEDGAAYGQAGLPGVIIFRTA